MKLLSIEDGDIFVGEHSANNKLKADIYLNDIVDTYFNGLVQDCSISIANALEISQSHPRPLISSLVLMMAGYAAEIKH